MRIRLLLILGLILAAPAFAQRFKIVINAETPEGQMLQTIGQEADEAKKIQMLEQFASQYPNNDSIAWVYSQLQTAYLKAGQPDKALQVGEKLHAIEPTDLETAHNNLKAAEATKDVEAIRKWAVVTSDSARKVAQSAKPADTDEEEAWKQRVDYAKQVDTYTEYALFAAGAANMSDPAKLIVVFETLVERNPQSPYVGQIAGAYIHALRQSNPDKAIAAGEALIEKGQNNEDVLLLLADHYAQKKQIDKVILYTDKIIETLPSKQKPENLSDAEWEKKKNLTLGVAYWMNGVNQATQNRFKEADKALRSALPLISSDQGMMAAALFHLGVSNYKLAQAAKNKGQMRDAIKFTQQCAALNSPFKARAGQNLTAMKTDPLAR